MTTRIGTWEREQVVRLLMTHQARGRLSAREYLERVALARAAVVAGDLEPLLADLAEPEAPARHRRVAGRHRATSRPGGAAPF